MNCFLIIVSKNRTSQIVNLNLLLSIIIVSYNVRFFLEQCLFSVQKAVVGMTAEVIVIDNNSPDKTVEYLQSKFPAVIFISNKENVGYARANNQGWQHASGQYILFLNPDTIVSEDSLQQSLELLKDEHAGAIGIHMVDGSGRFLPESKRGFPTPATSFYKLSGLAALFPHSATFSRYYLGHLSEDSNHEADVLAGAYMMLKRSLLEMLGGFDEQFFMYGEDVDLCYRVQKAGYKNMYLATTSIIHFKGESTKKDLKYVRLFYKAMSIFVKKHYGARSWWMGILLQLAIWCRQGMAVLAQPFRWIAMIGKKTVILNTLISGNDNEVQEVIQILKRTDRNITISKTGKNIASACRESGINEIVFCIGAASFKEVITQLRNLPGKVMAKFHAAGSSSIVGSASRHEGGEVIPMEH
jgi:N-acetylglucosaminyl-diphospho-decaprenol L-rhamnosyltransferase